MKGIDIIKDYLEDITNKYSSDFLEKCEYNLKILKFYPEKYEEPQGCPQDFNLSCRKLCYEDAVSNKHQLDQCERCWKLALDSDVNE